MSSVIAFILIAMEVCSAHPGCSPEYMTNRCQVPDVTDDLLGSVHETLRGYAAVIKGDVTPSQQTATPSQMQGVKSMT